MYLDGGIDAASELIQRVLLDEATELRAAEHRRDYKTELQEFAQRTPGHSLYYRLMDESGPDHDKTFTISVMLGDEVVGTGAAGAPERLKMSRFFLDFFCKKSLTFHGGLWYSITYL